MAQTAFRAAPAREGHEGRCHNRVRRPVFVQHDRAPSTVDHEARTTLFDRAGGGVRMFQSPMVARRLRRLAPAIAVLLIAVAPARSHGNEPTSAAATAAP